MIELASVIRDLREELRTAMREGREESLRFELGPIELDLMVVVDRAAEGGGKVRFWVVEFGAGRKKDTADTQRIKLTLTPRIEGEEHAPQISGRAEVGE